MALPHVCVSVLQQQKQLPDAEIMSVFITNEDEDERDLRLIASGTLGHVSILSPQLVRLIFVSLGALSPPLEDLFN